MSLRGASALFDTHFSYNLESSNQKMKYGVVSELNNSLNEQDLKECPRPKDKSTKWTLTQIDEEDFRSIVFSFPGAYVKEGPGLIVDARSGITMDLDASSLYPLFGGGFLQ